ncbi:unnamed protein product [Paramecium pentaurelia]|uniref:Uncharacterized protein n=1 Tax=Paramecium pentaurelia TaxID=43138 RepID=A0A8S1U566_9CILI|nr:unnamed protein product [Paramecium pentaurelia]
MRMVKNLVDGIFGKRRTKYNKKGNNEKVIILNLLVERNYMMKKEMALKLVSGLIWMINLIGINKQHIMVNLQMGTKLVNGIFGLIRIEEKLSNKQRRKNMVLQERDEQQYSLGESQNRWDSKLKSWVEIWDGQQWNSYVSYDDEYINGKKISRWNIWYKERVENKQNKKIEGGSYEEGGAKLCNWVKNWDGYKWNAYVTYCGQYLNGNKVSRWDIWYKERGENQQNKKIGGGSYDEEGKKLGIWVEIWADYQWNACVTFNGQYINGNKFGRWDIWHKFNKIGGGSYDEKGEKRGNWVEIWDMYNGLNQVTYSGDYKNGKKVGGCGSYDKESMKQGNWVELWNGYSWNAYVTYSGQYKNDNRVGKWDIWYQVYGINNMIGNGSYDEGGLKQGNWMEFCKNFGKKFGGTEFTFNGNYMKGKKIGQWNIWDVNKKMGGGQYDEGGVKFGNQVEIWQCENWQSYLIYNGKYKNGNRVGQWDIWYQVNGINNKIGGGQYDERGAKFGNWVEMKFDIWYNSQYTLNGEYKNGKKVGIWIELNRGKNEKLSEIIYDY